MNKKLFQYIDGQMNEAEKKAFKVELSKDEKLRLEYQIYLEKINNLKVNNDEIDENYYSEVITKFRSRNKADKKKKSFIPKLAYAAVAVLLIIASTLIFNNLSDSPKINDITEGMSNDELSSTLNNYFDNEMTDEEIAKVESELNKDISENILVDPTDSTSYDMIADANYSSIINNINDEEADLIYKELINKEFLGD